MSADLERGARDSFYHPTFNFYLFPSDFDFFNYSWHSVLLYVNFDSIHLKKKPDFNCIPGALLRAL